MDGRRRSRTYLAAFVAVLAAAVATGGLAAAEKPVIATAGTLVGYFNADFTPKKLSKTKPTPIRLDASANLRANHKTGHLPALKELLFKADKHIGIDVRGIPTPDEIPGCSSGRLPRRTIGAVRKACAAAVIGDGHLEGEVQFPDQPMIPIESELLIINGGADRGVTKLYLHTYFTAPVSSSIVATVEIRKIRKGRYGMEATAVIPKIAGGAGSVTHFNFSLKRGILSATCSDGRLSFHNESVFVDGTRFRQPVVRTCTARETAR